MKNKDIEELLNKIKQQLIIDERLGKEIAQDFHKTTLNYKETKLLLSYIEQLKKDKKELKDGWQQEIYDKNKVLSDWLEAERKVNVLENNRDKAIKKLNKYRNRKDHYGLWCMEYIDNADIIHILKGDIDYE